MKMRNGIFAYTFIVYKFAQHSDLLSMIDTLLFFNNLFPETLGLTSKCPQASCREMIHHKKAYCTASL